MKRTRRPGCHPAPRHTFSHWFPGNWKSRAGWGFQADGVRKSEMGPGRPMPSHRTCRFADQLGVAAEPVPDQMANVEMSDEASFEASLDGAPDWGTPRSEERR